jgi:hypothetical protein
VSIGLYTEETAKLAGAVSDGNTGAATLVDRLTHRTKWYEMMKWCKENDLTGSDLWKKYKDEFNEDFYEFGDWIEQKMRKDKSSLGKVTSKCIKPLPINQDGGD